jgi:periplasmic divalent cation tolerance protein
MKTEQFRPGIILVTAPNAMVAEKIASSLVEQNLAACVSMFPVTSIYRWQGKINTDSEVQLLLKVNIANFGDISEHIKSIHPYDVPEIVSVPIENGYNPYLKWMLENCR